MNKLVVVVFCLFVCSESKLIEFEDCGNGQMKDIDVSPCDQEPCLVEGGKPYSIKGFLVSDVDTDKPFMRLQEQSEGKWYNFQGVDTDPCQKIMKCPVKAGEKTPFELTVVAGDAIHDMDTNVRVKFYENANREKVIGCASARIHLK
ncbi:mite group 2 allergen Gly d 2.02-like [Brevipalpus obovatus]|uniref:mite group 2 allergen Gly d 2.02-like n=1 Tax=Brevipalpus obovatus TaxID=246614 RepID=UPI003D9F968D